MALRSHPVRITERDVMQEENLDEWFRSFQGYDLHVRLLCVRELSPANRSSLPNPYAVLRVGQQKHRTAAHRRQLDVDFGEEWTLEWLDVCLARRLLVLEIWSWKGAIWSSDELLGRAFIDINQLSFEPQEVLDIDLQLYPPSVTRPPPPPVAASGARDIQSLLGRGARVSGAEATDSDADAQPGGGGPGGARRGSALVRSTSIVRGLQRQLQQRRHPPAVGQLEVALWWSPARARHAFDAEERCSFCLSEAKVPPVLAHARLGELYEEPCIVYVKLSLLEVLLGPRWYDAYLAGAGGAGSPGHAAFGDAFSDASGAASDAGAPLWWWQRPPPPPSPPPASEGGDLLGVAAASLWPFGDLMGGSVGSPSSSRAPSPLPGPLGGLLSESPDTRGGGGGDGGAGSPVAGRGRASRAGGGGGAGGRPPVFALVRVQFGKHQRAESQPVRVSPAGRAAFFENFCFTTKRPLKDKRIVLEVLLRGEGLPGGKLLARAEWSSVDLLMQSPPPPTTWLGVHAARQNRLPGARLPLPRMEDACVELLCHAADADTRASFYGVPALSAAAAAPRRAATATAAAVAGAGPAEQAQRWNLLKQMALRRRAVPAPAAAGPSSPHRSDLGSRDGADGGGSDASGTFSPRSPLPGRPQRPGPAPSPIAGLPNSLGGVADDGPIAKLVVVLHRVELTPEPPKGYSIVLKCGPHWAQSKPRRSAELEWCLEVPIYHPTTTLTAVVHCEQKRGRRVEVLGKLQYRISNLLVISSSEQVKTLRLRSDRRDDRGVRCSAGTVLVSFRCFIPDRRRLMAAYERSPYPPTVHLISLFSNASRDAILRRHQAKVVAWLAAADPPIRGEVAWKLLETGRERFRVARARYNIQRVKEALGWLTAILDWFRDIKSWRRPWYNLLSVAVAYFVCFRPRDVLLLFLLYRSFIALRRLLKQSLAEYLGVELGELFDTAGLLPVDLLGGDEFDEEDDDAASAGSRAGGGGAAGAAAGGGGLDSAAAMMFRPRRLRALKRRYEQLLRVSLAVQNRTDDLATLFERLTAGVNGQDPLAAALFFTRALLGAALVRVAGLGTVVFSWWCWEVLRPPSWRRPPGIKGPIQFVGNLPSRSAEE